MLACTVSKQQREVLRRDKNRKLLKKETKKGWRGKGFGGASPSKGLVSHIEDSIVSGVAGTQGKMGKRAARKDKAGGHKNCL